MHTLTHAFAETDKRTRLVWQHLSVVNVYFQTSIRCWFRPHIRRWQEAFVCLLLGITQQTFVNIRLPLNTDGSLAAASKCSHIPQAAENNGDKWCQLKPLQTEQLAPWHQVPQTLCTVWVLLFVFVFFFFISNKINLLLSEGIRLYC